MRDYFVVALVILALPLCFLRPWIGIQMWLWLGFMNPHKLSWAFARTMPLAQMVGIAVLLGVLGDKSRKPIPWTRESIVVVVLGVYFTFTTFFAWAPIEAWEQWEKVVKILLMAMVATLVIHGKQRIQWMGYVVIMSLGFFGLKGGIFALATAGEYRVIGPEGSFIAGNTTLGLALTMVLPLFFYLGQAERDKKLLRWFHFAMFGFSTIACVFTYSRGALLGLAAVLAVLLIKANKKALLIMIAVPGLLLLANFAPDKLFDQAETIQTYEQDFSAMQRLQAWGVAFNVAKEKPFIGAGFNFEYGNVNARWLGYANFLGEWENEARAAHSIWFQVLGQHGFVAFGLFVYLLIAVMRRCRTIEKRTRSIGELEWMTPYASGIQVGMVGFLVTGTFLSLAYFDLLYTFVAMVVILDREVREYEAREREANLDADPTDAFRWSM